MIHRADINAKPACGSKFGKISTTGAMIDCPHCLEASKQISKEEAMKQIAEAASKFRTSHN